MKVNAFYTRIGSIMKDNMYDRTVVGFRSGKIANKTIYKTQIENQTKIFSRKQERANKQYAISILVDISGSMNDYMGYDGGEDNRRLAVAVDMVELLVKGLERNNIRFAVSFFGGDVETYKQFDKKMPKDLRKRAFNLMGGRMGQNTREGKALKESHRLLVKEKGDRKNKFCLVFTDGHSGDEIDVPLRELNKIAKVFPFGIGLDISHSHNGAGMRVCNKEIFMFKLLKVLEGNIQRG